MKISKEVSTRNKKHVPITDGLVTSIETGLTTVVNSYSDIVDFKDKYKKEIPELAGLPITKEEVDSLKAKLP